MRRNVLTTELLLPIALGAAIYFPIFAIGLLLGWSMGLLGVIELFVGVLLVFIREPVSLWLAPRIGLPPPRQFKSRRDA